MLQKRHRVAWLVSSPLGAAQPRLHWAGVSRTLRRSCEKGENSWDVGGRRKAEGECGWAGLCRRSDLGQVRLPLRGPERWSIECSDLSGRLAPIRVTSCPRLPGTGVSRDRELLALKPREFWAN